MRKTEDLKGNNQQKGPFCLESIRSLPSERSTSQTLADYPPEGR